MKYKTYTIEGKKFNAVSLGKELGVTQQTARNRLKVAKTIDELYRQLHSTKYKKHIIEGNEFTSVENENNNEGRMRKLAMGAW